MAGEHQFDILYRNGYGKYKVPQKWEDSPQKKSADAFIKEMKEFGQMLKDFFVRERSTYICPEKDGVVIKTGMPHHGDITWYRCITKDKVVFKYGGYFCIDGFVSPSNTVASACVEVLSRYGLSCYVKDEKIDYSGMNLSPKFDGGGVHLYNHRVVCDYPTTTAR